MLRQILVLMFTASLVLSVITSPPPVHASGLTIWSDNFESYSPGQSIIQQNVTSNPYFPKQYVVGSSSNCGNAVWEAAHPISGYNYSESKPCVTLNSEKPTFGWYQGAQFSASSAQAHTGNMSLYLQESSGPDKVAPEAYAGPDIPATVGGLVTYDIWVFLAPIFETSGAIYVTFASSFLRVDYNGGGVIGDWRVAYQNNPVQLTDLGVYKISSSTWHHITIKSLITGSDSAQYQSLIIDGATPLDAQLKGKTYAGRAGLDQTTFPTLPPVWRIVFWIANPYLGPNTLVNDSANTWVYIDDWSLSLSDTNVVTSTVTAVTTIISPATTTTTLSSYSTTTTSSNTITVFSSMTSSTSSTIMTSTTTVASSTQTGCKGKWCAAPPSAYDWALPFLLIGYTLFSFRRWDSGR